MNNNKVIDIQYRLNLKYLKSYKYMYQRACRFLKDDAAVKDRVIRVLESLDPMIDLSMVTMKYRYLKGRKNDFPMLEVRSEGEYDVFEEWLLDVPPRDYSLQEYLDFLTDKYLVRSKD